MITLDDYVNDMLRGYIKNRLEILNESIKDIALVIE